MHMEEKNGQDEPHLSGVEARSGSRTPVTRNILAISLVLIVALFIVVVGIGYLATDRSGADGVSADNTAREAGNSN
jgi:hypothetical protein